MPRVTAALIEVAPYDRQHRSNGIYKYIIQFRDLDVADALFAIYSRQLLVLGQMDKLKQLLSFDLEEKEKNIIMIECARYGFANNTNDMLKYLGEDESAPLLCKLYKYVKGNVESELLPLPSNDTFPQTIREHDMEERAKWGRYFYEQYLIGIFYGLAGKNEDVNNWINNAPDIWPALAMSRIIKAGTKVASGICNKKVAYADLFDCLSDLLALSWPDDREVMNYQYAFRNAIGSAIKDITSLKRYLNNDLQIDLAEYPVITAKPSFFSKKDLFDYIIDNDEMLLNQESYELARDENINNLSTTINHLSDRAKEYAKMSKLAYLYADPDKSRLFLEKAVDNLLGYGPHKDDYLFDVLEAIKYCAQFGMSKEIIDNWITKIAPLIDCVHGYADGVRGLPYELAELLAGYNPALLRKYYYYSAEKEDLYHAEALFKYVIKSLSFKNDVEIALASTADLPPIFGHYELEDSTTQSC
jgi:hypothetical protein